MERNYPGEKLTPTPELIGKLLFGSPKKLGVGLWIVGRDSEEPFSHMEAVDAYHGMKNASD